MRTAIEISAEVRTQLGKRASRRLRNQEKVLGTVYGGAKDSQSIMMEPFKLTKAMENEAFYSSILTLTVNGQPAEKVVVKAVQRHPYKPRLLHMDFFRINPKEKLSMHIPLHFIGDDKAPGLVEGGVISHLLNEVEIRCLPADLPEYIEVDLSKMQLGDYVYLADLKLPEGVEIVALMHAADEHNNPVASLHMPHIMEEPEETAPVSAEVPAIEVSADEPEEAAPEGKSGGKSKE